MTPADRDVREKAKELLDAIGPIRPWLDGTPKGNAEAVRVGAAMDALRAALSAAPEATSERADNATTTGKERA